MIEVVHLNAGARGSSRLVLDDRDRFDLVRRLVAALGDTLLAYCVMDTHVHVLAEGEAGATSEARRAMAEALATYARAFNTRHSVEGPLLRGPVEALRTPSDIELARALRYVHENPVRTRVPIVALPIEYEWSSARAFAGFSRVTFPNVERAAALVGGHARWAGVAGPPLAGLDATKVPSAGPELILAAAAQVFGADPAEVASNGRAPALVAARAVFVRVGRLESYREDQLALVLGRTRRRVARMASEPVDLDGARIARTLLARPELRCRLRPGRSSDRQKGAPLARTTRPWISRHGSSNALAVMPPAASGDIPGA